MNWKFFNRKPKLPTPEVGQSSGSWPFPWWNEGASFSRDGTIYTSLDQKQAHSVVWACMSKIARTLAACPYQTMSMSVVGEKKVIDDEISWLMNNRPNPETTALAFREALVYQALRHGNAFAQLDISDTTGKISALWLLDSSNVEAGVDEVGDRGYVYKQPDGSKVWIPEYMMFVLRAPSTDGMLGRSILDLADKAIGLACSAEAYASAYYANGAIVSGIIRGKTSPEEEKRVVQAIQSTSKGASKAHKVIFIPAELDFQAMSSDAEKTQVVQSRQFDVAAICRFFGVHPALIGDPVSSQGYGSNQIEIGIRFLNDTLTPWILSFTQEASYKLYSQRSPWREARLDTKHLTKGTEQQQAQVLTQLLQASVISINEARNSLGLSPVVGGDEVVPSPPPALPPPTIQPEEVEDEDIVEEDSVEEEVLDKLQRKVSARVSDLVKHKHTPETIETHISTIFQEAKNAE